MVLIFRICDKGWNDLFLCPLLFRTACISNAFLLVARLFKIRRRKIYSVLSISVSISFALPSFLYFRSQFQSSLFHLLFSCVYLKSLKQGCLSSKENILCQNSCVVGPSLSEASVWRSMSPPPWYSSLQLNSYFIGEVVPGPRFFFFFFVDCVREVVHVQPSEVICTNWGLCRFKFGSNSSLLALLPQLCCAQISLLTL